MSEFLDRIAERMKAIQGSIENTVPAAPKSTENLDAGLKNRNRTESEFNSVFPHETRLTLDDDIKTMAIKLCDGVIGALAVIKETIVRGPEIDPDSAMGPFNGMLGFDSYGIYGTSIWKLHKYVCGEDITNTLAVLRAAQLGTITKSDIHRAIQGEMLDVAAVLSKVQEQLPHFAKKEPRDVSAFGR